MLGVREELCKCDINLYKSDWINSNRVDFNVLKDRARVALGILMRGESDCEGGKQDGKTYCSVTTTHATLAPDPTTVTGLDVVVDEV